jgi:hypothetical protein
MRRAILKIKEGLADLTVVWTLSTVLFKGIFQKLFRENVTLSVHERDNYCTFTLCLLYSH